MPEIPVYSGSIGINNIVPPHRLKYDAETGVCALEDAVNFIVDRTGELVTRRGTELKVTGDFHSLFPACDDWALVAKNRQNDTAIYRVDVSAVDKSITITGIRDGLTKGKLIDWCNVGEKGDRVFYSNGSEYGVVLLGNTSVPWPDDTNDKSYITDQTRVFVKPQAGEHICFFAGRILFSVIESEKCVLRYTEYGRLGMYDKSRNGEVFASRILAIIPTLDGVYISTENNVYFVSGRNPKDWTSVKVLNYPVIEWCVFKKEVDPSFFGFETNAPSIVAGTINGPVIFLPSGNAVNLIDKNVKTTGCGEMSSGIAVFDESLVIQTGVKKQ